LAFRDNYQIYFDFAASKLTLDVTIRGTAKQAERDFRKP